jgi:hypothetical protein
MRGVDDRVATLEGRVQEQAARMIDFRDRAIEVRHAIEAVHADMAQLRADVDRRLTKLRDEMNRRFAETDHRFAWLVGIVITGFVTVIATIAGTFWATLQMIGDRL